MTKFILDKNYINLIEHVGYSPREVLKKALIAEDLFSHKQLAMTTAEYFRFMDALEQLSPSEDTLIKMATVENIETFSPPIFAAYCSSNALMCMERIAKYKRLISPLILLVNQDENCVTVEIDIEENKEELPKFLILTEMVFLLNLIRKATKDNIVPKKIMVRHNDNNPVYKDYFGIEPITDSKNILVLSLDDATKPFISQNDSMWGFFEPELKKRLDEIEIDESFSARVRSALTELLPGGQSGIEDVSKKLGYSKRTLQRKLGEENTSFQKQLNHTRELLAKHYLNNTDMTSNDIAYLLGYQDLNSFFRSFTIWTGMTISEYKKQS